MPEFSRLVEFTGGFELDFVEREATPKPLMKLSIHLRAAGLSLSDTVSVIDIFGVDRARSTVHNWVRKADLEPEGGNHLGTSPSTKASSPSPTSGTGSTPPLIPRQTNSYTSASTTGV